MIPLYEPHLGPLHKLAAIRQILSGWIGPGAAVERFAAALSARYRRRAVVTNSGTSALLLAFLALDLKPGAVVCCPDYGLPAAHNAARLLGLVVKLIDVYPKTGCMDVRRLQGFVDEGGRPGAVVYVDHNGHVGSGIGAASALCRKLGIPLIEDSAVALGCRSAGLIGDLSILSFSVPKIITTGQGGAVMAADPKVGERLAQLVDQGGGNWRRDRIHTAVGGNFRMADVQAAMGLAQLRDLPRLLARRERLWGWYREDVAIANDVRPSGWMVTTWGKDALHANEIIGRVNEAGFDARRLYQPVHRCTSYRGDDGEYPGAVDVWERLVYLPSSLNLRRDQVQRIAAAVRRAS